MTYPCRRDVLAYIETHPGCTSRDIADYYDVKMDLVRSRITGLYQQGYICREPEDLRDAPRGMCYRMWISEVYQ